jgi:pyruvate/2-oxoglutarate/acetoin dehydrogenase E1 component
MTYSEAINEAMQEAMQASPDVICYGLGVNDPKAIFGTTKGLVESFGNERVFDMPTAENGMLGVGIGAALNGLKPIMVHQRLDFFLLAMDQLVNSAAKWFFMFGGQQSVPITIRLILGRGWGQGPTHSQSLHAWFAHIPGLKVVMPSNPNDAKGLLLSSIFDPNPVIFLEHRWLHNQVGMVESGPNFQVKIGEAKLVREGRDITIVSMGYQTIEAIKACEALAKNEVDAELIDLRSIKPIDWALIYKSVSKTGRILALDTGVETCSVSSEILAKVSANCFSSLLCAPQQIAMPDIPEPTSFALTKDFYFGADCIAKRAHQMVHATSADVVYDNLKSVGMHDVPGDYFTGPF